MILCFTGVMVVKEKDVGKIIAAFLHTVAIFLATTVYAYSGQKLIDKSEIVCNEVFMLDIDYVPIIAIGQKGVAFDGGFYDASLETLSATVSKIISFVMLVKSFVK